MTPEERKVAKAEKAAARLRKRIERRNAAFKKLTASQRRVTVAKDVLAQVRAKRIAPRRGKYWAPRMALTREVAAPGMDFSEVLTRIPECQACAVGSLFMCAVQRADNLRLGPLATATTLASEYFGGGEATIRVGQDAHNYLATIKLFSKAQRARIERTFETNLEEVVDGKTVLFARLPGLSDQAPSRYTLFLNDVASRDRMNTIMRCIVRNNGTFKLDAKIMADARRLNSKVKPIR